MKKIFLATVLGFLPLFSYQIDFNKKFSKIVNPDLLVTYVSVDIEKKDEKSVNKDIEKFNDFFKKNTLVNLKNGSYNLNPRYNYYKNKQEFRGFVGSLRYKIESKEAKPLNDFISKLIEVKNSINSKDTKLNISQINWNVSDKLYSETVDALRFETIQWVNNYSKELSTKLSKKCAVKNISFSPIHKRGIIYERNEAMYSAAKSSLVMDVSPQNTQEKISIDPTFILECK